jgi:hypothetical protein
VGSTAYLFQEVATKQLIESVQRCSGQAKQELCYLKSDQAPNPGARLVKLQGFTWCAQYIVRASRYLMPGGHGAAPEKDWKRIAGARKGKSVAPTGQVSGSNRAGQLEGSMVVDPVYKWKESRCISGHPNRLGGGG